MNILGYDIDPNFVYMVHPIQKSEATYGYRYTFIIDFNDGRSHRVKIDNNYKVFEYRDSYYVDSKSLTKHKELVMRKKQIKDLEIIKSLREKIISAKK